MTLYGAATYSNLTANRIDPLLNSAQAATVRTTGLQVSVIDSRINRWVELAGTNLQPSSLTDSGTATSQDYKYYRLQMAMCILSNGNIIRARVGDGTNSNRNIYVQTITDPTVASQWTSWSLLYSGLHFAVGVVPATASTYHLYAAKSDGIYKNNTKKQSITGVIAISPIQAQADAMFVTKLRADPDGRQVMDLYYSSNIETTGFSDDTVNYRWIRTEISALKLSSGKIARAQIAGFNINPRSTDLAESLTISFASSYTAVEPETPPLVVRGFAGKAGSNSIRHVNLVQLSDGYYYLFYTEVRFDADKTVATSQQQTVFWQRSIDLIHWSEPVAVGYNLMSPTGTAIVEKSGYAYLAGNGAVYQRPTSSTTYDLTNYVNKVQLDLPKSNDTGSGQFSVANPAGVNDSLLDLTDCEVQVKIGLRCSDGVYRYSEFGRWWISRIERQAENKVNRLQVQLYDLWRRLDNPLRDNYNNIGQVNWYDWAPGKKQQLYNYYARGGKFKRIKVGVAPNQYYLVHCDEPTSSNAFLYTGWKGHNGTVSVRYRSTPLSDRRLGIVFRWVNAKNYYWVYSDGDTLYVRRVQNGEATTLGSHAKTINDPFTLKVSFKWGIYKVYVNDVLEFTVNEALSGTNPGYTGVRGTGSHAFRISSFYFSDWQYATTTNDLITSLLAMGDFHNPSVSGGEAPQLAVVWGPQTDLNTPAKALLSLCEQFKLELAWRGGRVEVGQFKEKTIVGSYQNEVLDVKRTEELGQRINLAVVDGKEDTWIEIDGSDTRFRGRQIVAYFDVPDLDTDDKVRLRAQEEIRKGVIGSAYECQMPLQFDLWRMDGITVVDNGGTSRDLKIEGMSIEVVQDSSPQQHMTLELSPLT